MTKSAFQRRHVRKALPLNLFAGRSSRVSKTNLSPVCPEMQPLGGRVEATENSLCQYEVARA